MRHPGQRVNTTQSYGIGVALTWVILFEVNEKNWREDPASCLTNEELYDMIMDRFPDRWESQILKQVNKIRAAYNRGRLVGVQPLEQSYRYLKVNGQVIRATARGKPIERKPVFAS